MLAASNAVAAGEPLNRLPGVQNASDWASLTDQVEGFLCGPTHFKECSENERRRTVDPHVAVHDDRVVAVCTDGINDGADT